MMNFLFKAQTKNRADKNYHHLFTLATSVILTACATPNNEHFYQLRPVEVSAAIASTTTSHAAQQMLILRKVQIPANIDRPQMVVQKSATEAVLTDDQKWIAPIDDQITDMLHQSLRQQLPKTWITLDNDNTSSLKHYYLIVRIEQLTIDLNSQVTLVARWRVTDSDKKLVLHNNQTFVSPIKTNHYESAAPAVSIVVQNMANTIAQDIILKTTP